MSESFDRELSVGTRRMEVTEEKLLEGRDEYLKGAVEVFDLTDPVKRAISVKWHDFGWAKDVETGETGERKAGAVSLEAHGVVSEA